MEKADTGRGAVRELAGLAGMLDASVSTDTLARAHALSSALHLPEGADEVDGARNLLARINGCVVYLETCWIDAADLSTKERDELRIALILGRMLITSQDARSFNARAKAAVGWTPSDPRAEASELGVHFRTVRRQFLDQGPTGTQRRRHAAAAFLDYIDRWQSSGITGTGARAAKTWSVDTAGLMARSVRYLADLDIVATLSDDEPARLSQGLYVNRAVQEDVASQVMGGLGDDVLVIGEAGHGKSSLLWWLQTKLLRDPECMPLLISAAWLVPTLRLPQGSLSPEVIDQALAEIVAAGQRPVLLLDTADLLLHDATARDIARSCLDSVRNADGRMVITCRPVEARLLRPEKLKEVHLGAYSSDEVASAVAALSACFCPNAAIDEGNDRIGDAIVRGLPAREVVTSPLLLRVLFELRSPVFPVLRELDVTALYEEYWKRRVVADVRDETSPRDVDHADLSMTAGLAGVALLSLGIPEAPGMALARYVDNAHAAWSGPVAAALEPSREAQLDLLRHRGVLQSGPTGTVKFFHQTFFEYAAARGLIRRDGMRALDRLLKIVLENPDDLFSGAVLEQVLILLGREPDSSETIRQAVSSLVGSEDRGLQSIAMMLLAHYPGVALGSVRDLLGQCSPQTLTRFGYAAPTVYASTVQPTMELLELIWNRPARDCSQLVLQTMCRLGQRDEASCLAVANASAKWGVLDLFLSVDASRIVSNPDIPALLRLLAPVQPIVVQRAVLTLVKLTGDLTTTLLDIVSSHWTFLGSVDFLNDVATAVEASQLIRKDRDGKPVREALGRVYSKHWLTKWHPASIESGELLSTEWQELLDETCQGISEDSNDVLNGAKLAGLAYVLKALPDGSPHIDVALARVRTAPTDPWQLRRSFYPLLLSSESPARVRVATQFKSHLGELPAKVHNGIGETPTPETWAAVARASLDDERVPANLVLNVLEGLPARNDDLWLREDGLVVFLLLAAYGGHPAASRALEAVRRDPAQLEGKALTIVSARFDRPELVHGDDIDVVITLAIRSGNVTQIRVLSADTRLNPEFRRHAERLEAFIEKLLHGTGGQQVTGANLWYTLIDNAVLSTESADLRVAIEAASDPRAKAALIRLLALHASRYTEAASSAIEFVGQFITISTEPAPEIQPSSTKVKEIVAEAARSALLQLNGLVRVADTASIQEVFALAVAPRIDRERTYDIENYAHAGKFITSLVTSGHEIQAIQLLELLVEQETLNRFTTNQLNGLANKLRQATRTICMHAAKDDVERLVSLVAGAEPTFARILVNSLLRDRYDESGPLLRQIAPGTLPRGVGEEISRGTRRQQRRVGTTRHLELLQPL